MSASWPPDVDLLDEIDQWLYKQRWFPGSTGESVRLVANIDLSAYSAPLDFDKESGEGLDPVWISIIQVGEAYVQVPLVYTDEKLDYGVVSELRGAYLVDGAYAPSFLRAWLRKAYENDTLSPIEPELADDVLADLLAAADNAFVLSGEQSNTSVMFDSKYSCVLKILRVLQPGTHPEVEITSGLAREGWEHIAKPIAYLDERIPVGDLATDDTVLGFAGAAVKHGRDGFELFVEMASAGEDPSSLARELGATTAGLHEHMASAFGASSTLTPGELRERLHVNLSAAAAEVPDIRDSDLTPRLEAAIDQIGNLDSLPPLIRIHGDYHLGQVLLGDQGWVVLDFEGEPLRPLAERRVPDLALRDVAGMLRSFDYAAAKGGAKDGWLSAARDSFIAGYTRGGGFGEVESELIRVLEIEKAAYEAVYEYRMRPDWIWIPENALRRLAQ
ncbi:MAG: phosphotransferase [Actinomycetaceae bacterium]|nr:phosphotransferase [Actinomycetaceae bacterium]